MQSDSAMASQTELPGRATAGSAPTSSLSSLKQRFQAMTLNQRLGFGAGLLVMCLLVGLALISSRAGQGYKVLFSNVSDADGAAIIASLQQLNVPYQFTEGGGAILVPQANVYETRLKLAGQGLPKAGNVGFELLENQKFGTSQFVERINYQRGLEGELARSIASLGQVKSARVHLAVPKQTAFVREQERPTASVVVMLHPGRMLDPAQVAAISRLVSSSVPGMQVQDVAILDAGGGVVSPNPIRQAGLDPSQIKYTAELESALTRRLAVILEPLAGKDGFRAEVTVDMDFDERERTSETFGRNSPPNAQAIRSQQSMDSTGGASASGGIPGALTNQPQRPAEAPIVNEVASNGNGASRTLKAPGEVETGVAISQDPGQTQARSERTVNYEVDRAIERLKSSKGNVRRISAAVILDHKMPPGAANGTAKVPFSPQEITQINSLVKDAIGYVQARGDTVSVANLPFSVEVPVETPAWTPELTSQLLSYGSIALAVLFGYFAVLRPLLKPLPPPVEIKEPVAAPEPALTNKERLRKEISEREEEWELQQETWRAEAEFKERADKLEASRQQAKEASSKMLYDDLVDYTQNYVSQKPQDAALLLRAWVDDMAPTNQGESA